jgi:hypothetical protein
VARATIWSRKGKQKVGLTTLDARDIILRSQMQNADKRARAQE